MNQPPRIARWLLAHFGCNPNSDAVIGDLDERYRDGRSAGWYNRQAFLAFVRGWYDAISKHAFLTVSVLLLSALYLAVLTVVFVSLARGAANPLTAYAFGKVFPESWWAYNAIFWPVDLILTWMPLFLISVAAGLIIVWIYGVHGRAMLVTCFAFTFVCTLPVVFRMLLEWRTEPAYFGVRGILTAPLTLLGLMLAGCILRPKTWKDTFRGREQE